MNYTTGRDINDSRVVAGEFGNGTFHGYFLDGTTFTQFDVAGATSTFVLGLNNAGDFAGAFDFGTDPRQGFLSVGGSIVAFSIPGATSTVAFGLNNSDQIVGRYFDSGLIQHGFFR